MNFIINFVPFPATPLQPPSLIRNNNGRIVGGDDAEIEDVPYQVSLSLWGYLYCGGSIISENWVVTAAHCATQSPSRYTIRAGSNRATLNGSTHKVDKIISHENYGNVQGFDIALMHVTNPFKFNEKRKPIPLFEQNEEAVAGSIAVISGWGDDYPKGVNILQRAKVPIISKRKCHENYLDMGGIPDNEICAGYSHGGTDSCQGDSGGPLAINGRLAGITSWGRGCAQAKYPGVYTEVAAHRSWIKSITGV